MKRSKYIALSILLIAAMVMILNNARPHHHHHYQVCFSTEHCDDEGVCHSDESAEGHGFDHQHNHPINELCKVNGFYIIPDTKSQTVKVPARTAGKSIQLFAVLSTDQVEPDLAGMPLFGYHSKSSTRHAVKSLARALRAPPSC